MTDYEAYQLAIAALELSHIHGESVLEQMQFWAGVSYGILALTLVAPQRLTVGATSLVLVLYILFSATTLTNMRSDLVAGMSSVADASTFLEENQRSLILLDKKLSTVEESRRLTQISILFIPGLFFGTIGYVLISARREYKAKKNGQEA